MARHTYLLTAAESAASVWPQGASTPAPEQAHSLQPSDSSSPTFRSTGNDAQVHDEIVAFNTGTLFDTSSQRCDWREVINLHLSPHRGPPWDVGSWLASQGVAVVVTPSSHFDTCKAVDGFPLCDAFRRWYEAQSDRATTLGSPTTAPHYQHVASTNAPVGCHQAPNGCECKASSTAGFTLTSTSKILQRGPR